MNKAYEKDLAYIHDVGFGWFARDAAPGVLQLLADRGIHDGLVVDLGCGSGIWAKELTEAGYDVAGCDISAAMIAIARRRVPRADLHVASFLDYELPRCRAVTALGEIFNYRFDRRNGAAALKKNLRRIYQALEPGGVLIFDVAEPGRNQDHKQGFWEGDDWATLVDFHHDSAKQQLTRRIVTFRKVGKTYRRSEETHHQQLYRGAEVAKLLRGIGFKTRTMRSYGDYRLFDHTAALVARKPQ